jgi:hypothetical protein
MHPPYLHSPTLLPVFSLSNLSNECKTRFDITPKGQQIHISSSSPLPNEPTASRHPCFKLESKEKLQELRERIWSHFERGGGAAPMAADRPGGENSGEFCSYSYFYFYFGFSDWRINRVRFWVMDGGGMWEAKVGREERREDRTDRV